MRAIIAAAVLVIAGCSGEDLGAAAGVARNSAISGTWAGAGHVAANGRSTDYDGVQLEIEASGSTAYVRGLCWGDDVVRVGIAGPDYINVPDLVACPPVQHDTCAALGLSFSAFLFVDSDGSLVLLGQGEAAGCGAIVPAAVSFRGRR